MNRITAELLGTFFLCLFTLMGNLLGVGLGLAALIWVLGPVSGAYFNPAVTVSQRLHGAISAAWSLAYVGAQLLAALAAALVAALMTGYDAEKAADAPMGAPDAWLCTLSAEVFGTFLLAFVILGVANARRNAGNSFAALAIGGVVFAIGSAFGDQPTFLNPAVTLSSGLRDLLSALRADTEPGKALAAELIRFGKFAPWMACLVAGQLTGALLANACFWVTHPEDRAR